VRVIAKLVYGINLILRSQFGSSARATAIVFPSGVTLRSGKKGVERAFRRGERIRGLLQIQ